MFVSGLQTIPGRLGLPRFATFCHIVSAWSKLVSSLQQENYPFMFCSRVLLMVSLRFSRKHMALSGLEANCRTALQFVQMVGVWSARHHWRRGRLSFRRSRYAASLLLGPKLFPPARKRSHGCERTTIWFAAPVRPCSVAALSMTRTRSKSRGFPGTMRPCAASCPQVLPTPSTTSNSEFRSFSPQVPEAATFSAHKPLSEGKLGLHSFWA